MDINFKDPLWWTRIRDFWSYIVIISLSFDQLIYIRLSRYFILLPSVIKYPIMPFETSIIECLILFYYYYFSIGMLMGTCSDLDQHARVFGLLDYGFNKKKFIFKVSILTLNHWGSG